MKLILKIFTSMICALIVWELILETTIEKSNGFVNHPVLGRINKSGIYLQSSEGFSRTKVNSLGMRGEEISPKANNEYRILALGDSYTRGVHVSDSKTYSYLLQKNLENNNLKTKIKTINAGRDGGSPADYLYLASFYNSSVKPDSVIIQFTDQDFTEDIFNNKKQNYVKNEGNNYEVVHNDKFLSDDALSRIFLQKFPQLSFMLEYSVLRVGGKNLQKILGTKQNQPNESAAESLQKESSRLSQYEAVVDWTIENLKEKYPQLVILYLTDYNNIKEKPTEIEVFLRKFTAKHNVYFVDMRDDYTNYYKVHHQPAYGFNNTLPGRGHINEIGHALAAERLAVLFKERILK